VRSAIASQKPVLGICLGLQWMFEGSEEAGELQGLGIFPGHCTRFSERVKSPHVGWNRVAIGPHSRLLRDIPSDSYVYFTIRIGRRCVPTPAPLVSTRRRSRLRRKAATCSGCNFIPKSPATSE